MTLTAVQIASVRNALAALEANTEFAHSTATIVRIAGRQVADEVQAVEAEYRQFNKGVAVNTANLSPDAAEYWADWQKMYRAGRQHHALGGHGKREKKVSRMCEALMESFDARVPDNEKGKFLVHDIKDLSGDNWDDRWHACVDHYPPVLRLELTGSASIPNPKGRAQKEVLAGLLKPAPVIISNPPMTLGANARLRELARRLNQ